MRAATPEDARGCLAEYLDTEHPLEMNVSREERIYVVLRRRGIQCPRLARRLHMRGIAVEPDTLYRMLRRTVKPGGRGREPHVRAILAETERILGLGVDDGQAGEVAEGRAESVGVLVGLACAVHIIGDG